MNLTLGDTKILIDRAKKVGLLRNQLAYLLATAYWESGRSMKPVKEAYYLGKKAEAYRKTLRYYPWYGRGYVQLTWKDNYIRAGKELDLDLTSDPDDVMEPTIAADIIVAGMKEGWFTGKKLSDYITLQKSNFKGARKIINGTDKDDEIAAIAVQYDKLLKEAGYGLGATQEPIERLPDDPGVLHPEERDPSVEPSVALNEPATNFIEMILILISKLFGGKK